MDVSSIESIGDIAPSEKNITGNITIVAPYDPAIQRKLNKIEKSFADQIVSKNQHFHGGDKLIIFIIFEGRLQDFQNIVVEINGIKEITNFRYLIIN